MALMFNLLRANDLVWSNVINNYLLGKEPPAFDVLYWNNDGTRVTKKAHTFYLRHFWMENSLVKHGELLIKGVPIDLGNLRQDVYTVAMMQDHIVPWIAAWRMTQLVGGSAHFALGGSGHVAGIVAPPSKAKGYYWPRMLTSGWRGQRSTRAVGGWIGPSGYRRAPVNWSLRPRWAARSTRRSSQRQERMCWRSESSQSVSNRKRAMLPWT